IMHTAIEQANEGRQFILSKMLECVPEVAPELSKYAPRIISFQIDPEKIGDVVGKQGKVINSIIAETGTKIDIEDDGTVCIASFGGDPESAKRAKAIIESIVRDPEVGDLFIGRVVRILSTMGAFVEFAPGKDGMIHISKMADHRIEKVEDVLSVGDVVKVKIIKIGEKGIDFKLVEKMA
ncbi:MAG: S1 RNA-binding domain-containing protein, partial [Clostridia bacterium]|nr:S1 RNA-binding domain-containing protein [Clostridia bacterium]